MIQRAVKEKERIGLSEKNADQISPNLLLILIHDAIAHLITPAHRIPRIIPVLEEIAHSLDEQQCLLKEFLVRDQKMRFARGKVAKKPPKFVERSRARIPRSV